MTVFNCERGFWWNSSDFNHIGEDLDSAYEYIKGCGWYNEFYCNHPQGCSVTTSTASTWRAALCCPNSTSEGSPWDECDNDPLAVHVIYSDRYNSKVYYSGPREACESLPQDCGVGILPVRCPNTNEFVCGDDEFEERCQALDEEQEPSITLSNDLYLTWQYSIFGDYEPGLEFYLGDCTIEPCFWHTLTIEWSEDNENWNILPGGSNTFVPGGSGFDENQVEFNIDGSAQGNSYKRKTKISNSYDLPNGFYIKFTINETYSNSDWNLNDHGINPGDNDFNWWLEAESDITFNSESEFTYYVDDTINISNEQSPIDLGMLNFIHTISATGCTNPLAENYNPNALEDDGSCIVIQTSDYEGKIVIVEIKPTSLNNATRFQYIKLYNNSEN